MSKRLVCFAYLGGFLLSGCTGLPSSEPLGSASSEEIIRGGDSGASRKSEAVYLLLASELAVQRGEYDIALQSLMKAAKLTDDVNVAKRATRVALYLKDNDKLLEASTLWRQKEPSSLEAAQINIMSMLKAGKMDAALEAFGFMAPLLDPSQFDSVAALVDLIKLLEKEVPSAEADRFVDRLVERFPKKAEIRFAYALYAADKGDHRVALEQLDTALSLQPDWNQARLLQAQILTRMGASEQAFDVIQKALKREPHNTRLRLIYSQLIAKAGDMRRAREELDKILTAEPGNEDARLNLALMFFDGGDAERAQKEFMHLIDSAKWKMQSYFYLGLIESGKSHFQTALQWFDKVVEGPLFFEAKLNSVTSLVNLGQLQEAFHRINEVRRSNPTDAVKLYLLEAELLVKTKNSEAAFERLTEALEKMPGQPELLYMRALIAEQLEHFEVVESDLRAVLEKNPDDANALNALGFTLADRSDRLEEAKKMLGRAIELKPDDPAILDSLGWLHYRLGEYPIALGYLKRAYAKISDPEIGAHLGEVLWESGEKKAARKVWLEALKKDASHQEMKKIKAHYPEAFK